MSKNNDIELLEKWKIISIRKENLVALRDISENEKQAAIQLADKVLPKLPKKTKQRANSPSAKSSKSKGVKQFIEEMRATLKAYETQGVIIFTININDLIKMLEKFVINYLI
jgi:hypothetical protein